MPITKNFNNYKTIGNDTIIFLENAKGDVIAETIIDTEDLEKIKNTNYRFSLWKKLDYKYCKASVYETINGKRKGKTFWLHHLIVENPPKEYMVGHIDHDPLNNRKSNLRIIKRQHNLLYRKKENSNNKSGYRNVSFHDGWYLVQLQINKKNTVLGKFKDVDDAGAFAEEMGQKYYGKFAGSN